MRKILTTAALAAVTLAPLAVATTPAEAAGGTSHTFCHAGSSSGSFYLQNENGGGKTLTPGQCWTTGWVITDLFNQAGKTVTIKSEGGRVIQTINGGGWHDLNSTVRQGRKVFGKVTSTPCSTTGEATTQKPC